MKTLEMKEMEIIEGGQVETCSDLSDVMGWLYDNGHFDQFDAIVDRWWPVYCGRPR